MPCKITELRIRPGRPADVPLLQAIDRAATGRYAEMPQTRFCLELPVRDDAEHRLARECGLAVVIDLEGVPVGFALAMPKDGCAHLLEVAGRAKVARSRLRHEVDRNSGGLGARFGIHRDDTNHFPRCWLERAVFSEPRYESIEIGSDRPRTRWSDCGRTAIGLSWRVAHRDAQVVRSLKNKQVGPMNERLTPTGGDTGDKRVRLVRLRLMIASSLTAAIVTIYFSFMALFAFGKPVLGVILVPGLSLGILSGILIIICSFILCFVYVAWASAFFDPGINATKEE